ncbi:hypothetical protein BDW22DRAFT_318587 [Trametopsis cervina]|nr:hypothetical protein BDW22DRAFT_318587 [Trametopsis cervina]
MLCNLYASSAHRTSYAPLLIAVNPASTCPSMTWCAYLLARCCSACCTASSSHRPSSTGARTPRMRCAPGFRSSSCHCWRRHT